MESGTDLLLSVAEKILESTCNEAENDANINAASKSIIVVSDSIDMPDLSVDHLECIEENDSMASVDTCLEGKVELPELVSAIEENDLREEKLLSIENSSFCGIEDCDLSENMTNVNEVKIEEVHLSEGNKVENISGISEEVKDEVVTVAIPIHAVDDSSDGNYLQGQAASSVEGNLSHQNETCLTDIEAISHITALENIVPIEEVDFNSELHDLQMNVVATENLTEIQEICDSTEDLSCVGRNKMTAEEVHEHVESNTDISLALTDNEEKKKEDEGNSNIKLTNVDLDIVEVNSKLELHLVQENIVKTLEVSSLIMENISTEESEEIKSTSLVKEDNLVLKETKLKEDINSILTVNNADLENIQVEINERTPCSLDKSISGNIKINIEENVNFEKPTIVENISEKSNSVTTDVPLLMDVDLKTNGTKLNEHCLRHENVDQRKINFEILSNELIQSNDNIQLNEELSESSEIYIVNSFDPLILGNSEFQELTSKKAVKNVEEGKEKVCNKKAKNEIHETTKPKKNSSGGKKEDLVIPNHVMGHNILNTAVESNRNGKSIKPRLGVKVPSRTLTSQIVSKQEIANVILERHKQRNTQKVYGSNTLFARKLTKVLANRIAPLEKNSTTPPKSEANSSKMQNSDLLAILEGNEEVVEENIRQEADKKENTLKTVQSNIKKQDQQPKIKKKQADLEELPENEFVKALEQQLALKQLNELHLDRGNSKTRTTSRATYNRNVESSSMEKPDVKKVKLIQEKLAIKKSAKHPKILNLSEKTVKPEIVSPLSQKTLGPVSSTNIDDKEPKFKTNVPFKTYTRKRKHIDELPAAPESKKLLTNAKIKDLSIKTDISIDTYMTKSSRIIKRKVIWDPDESPARLYPLKVAKPNEKALSLKEEKRSLKSTTLESKALDKIPKKRLTEVDKLLMDEGAVNMLYAVKNTDEQNVNKQKKKKSNIISLEKAQKELLNKTNEIKNDLQTNTTKESPKSLRKKESLPTTPKKIVGPSSINRQKSRDSVRSSIQSPPSSPSFMHLEASRIIRRHSSDSFSSEDEEKTRTSATNENKVTERITRSKIVSPLAEPQKNKKTVKKTGDAEEKLKMNEELSKKFSKLIETDNNNENFVEIRHDALIVRKRSNFTEIIILHNDKKVLLNGEVMDAICLVLIEASEDSDCNAVLITSSGNSFCHGLDYKALICDKEQTRKAIAKEMAIKVREFLKCLASFPKILVCGVQGDVEGFGVMMLPLFDVIIASDTATFTTQYARLGCVPEGSSILTLPHLMHNVLVSELLYTSRKLIAAEALRIGLVTRVLWPDKFEEELSSTIKMIAKQSSQFMLATKKILRQNMLCNLDVALKLETDVLVKHWTSNECQKNFSLYG